MNNRQWTFGQKIALGFTATTVLTLLVSLIAVFSLHSVVLDKDRVIDVNERNLIDADQLITVFEGKSAAGRGYLLTADPRFLDEERQRHREFAEALQRLRGRGDDDSNQHLLDEIEAVEKQHQEQTEAVLELRRNEKLQDAVAAFDARVIGLRNDAVAQIEKFKQLEQRNLDDAQRSAAATATLTTRLVLLIAIVAVAVAATIAIVLSRSLTRQLGMAVQHIQTSATQLQSATTEQASSSSEQRSAATETATTLKELAATSRQMLESAQRVTGIADDTASAARSGDNVVQGAQTAITGIKAQVELIVNHMLDLGRKSQQVGGVLELINELAEQTNILAINATIESAGAGEAGKRFAAVADEIRKLADRVAGSTKEIRTLIEEIRSAANKTVMATEDGAKAVDAGTRQFGDVAEVFRRIGSRVQTTTEAAREIELGSKQQVTAVEQVNVALQGIVQATTQTEITTRQTQETATQLAGLARNLVAMTQSTRATNV